MFRTLSITIVTIALSAVAAQAQIISNPVITSSPTIYRVIPQYATSAPVSPSSCTPPVVSVCNPCNSVATPVTATTTFYAPTAAAYVYPSTTTYYAPAVTSAVAPTTVHYRPTTVGYSAWAPTVARRGAASMPTVPATTSYYAPAPPVSTYYAPSAPVSRAPSSMSAPVATYSQAGTARSSCGCNGG